MRFKRPDDHNSPYFIVYGQCGHQSRLGPLALVCRKLDKQLYRLGWTCLECQRATWMHIRQAELIDQIEQHLAGRIIRDDLRFDEFQREFRGEIERASDLVAAIVGTDQ